MSAPETFPPNFVPYGYFRTMTSEQVGVSGGHQPIQYLRNIYEDQYEYFTKATNVVVHPSEDLSSDPGEFDLSVFYDKLDNSETGPPTEPPEYTYNTSYFFNLPTEFIIKYNQSTDTAANTTAQQTSQTPYGDGCPWEKQYIYIFGGYHGGGNYNGVDELEISTDTVAVTTANVQAGRWGRKSTSKDSTRIITAGGVWFNPIGHTLGYVQNKILQYIVSTQTSGVPAGTPLLVRRKGSMTNLIQDTTKTWLPGGSRGPYRSTSYIAIAEIESYTFSTDTTEVLTSTLTHARSNVNGTSFYNEVNGYILPGYNYYFASGNHYSSINYFSTFIKATETNTDVVSPPIAMTYNYHNKGMNAGTYGIMYYYNGQNIRIKYDYSATTFSIMSNFSDNQIKSISI